MSAIHCRKSSIDCLCSSLEGRFWTGNTVDSIDRIYGRLQGMYRSMDCVLSDTQASDIRLEILDIKVLFWNGFGCFYNTHLGTVCSFGNSVTYLLANSTSTGLTNKALRNIVLDNP